MEEHRQDKEHVKGTEKTSTIHMQCTTEFTPFFPSEKLCTLGILQLQQATPCTQVEYSNVTLKVQSISTLSSLTKDDQIISMAYHYVGSASTEI